MIDIETLVFASVASKLREKYQGISVSGEEYARPADFPAVTIVERDNSVYTPVRTTQIENAVSLMYEVNVYSNSERYHKQECKEILADVDEVLSGLGFTRMICNPVTNLQESKIYRMLARYEGIADKDFCIYQS